MDLKAIKELAQAYSTEQLMQCADELEMNGSCACTAKTNLEEAMSDILQSLEVRTLMDSGNISLQEAVREFSKRVRVVLSK